MKVIRDIANSIDDMIVMTADVPTNHGKNRVPMLDVEVWIDEIDNKAYYSFYEKETKSPYVVSKGSAMPISKKIECMGQEVFRRLHNTKIEIHGKEILDIMNRFMMNLKISGYNSFDRYQILQSGFNCYEKLRSKVDNGSRPFYRNRHFEKQKRKYEKLEKKTSWFTKKSSGTRGNIKFHQHRE